jgi:VIT1/CCC1 family predicted Fe2+/Mn2+ transporter
LSTKTEGGERPWQSAYSTGIAYVFAVILLVAPFFIFSSAFAAIAATIGIALLIILFFTFYLAVVKDYTFSSRFLEMAAISLGVAVISFGIGFVVRRFFGLEI